MKQLFLDVDMACVVCDSVIWQGSPAFGQTTDQGEPVVCVRCYRSYVQPSPMLPVSPTDSEDRSVGRVAA